jgi:hypothetical protein
MAHPSRLSLALHSKTKAIQHECLNLRPADVIPQAVRDYLSNGMICLAEALMEAEMQVLVGTRWAQYPGRELKRYGRRHGQISVFGRKRKIGAPRVRIIGGKEMQLLTYALLNDDQILSEGFAAAWLACDAPAMAASLLESHLQSFDLGHIPIDTVIKESGVARERFLTAPDQNDQTAAFFIDDLEFSKESYIAVAAIDTEKVTRILTLQPGSLHNNDDCKKPILHLVSHASPHEADDDFKDIFIIPDSPMLRRNIRESFPRATVHTCYDFDPQQTPGTRIEQDVEGTGIYSSPAVETTLQQLKSWTEAL